MGLLAVHLKHPDVTAEHLGLLPFMIDPDDPKPAKEQFNAEYQHGGGWRPFEGFEMLDNDDLKYPDDPPLSPIAEMYLRDERILIYEFDWVAIIQPDRSFEVCRMD